AHRERPSRGLSASILHATGPRCGGAGWLESGLFIGCGKRLDDLGQLDNFEMRRTFTPVVPPTHNKITAIRRMAVVPKVAALKLKLDPYTLPLPWTNLSFGFTVWKPSLDSLH